MIAVDPCSDTVLFLFDWLANHLQCQVNAGYNLLHMFTTHYVQF